MAALIAEPLDAGRRRARPGKRPAARLRARAGGGGRSGDPDHRRRPGRARQGRRSGPARRKPAAGGQRRGARHVPRGRRGQRAGARALYGRLGFVKVGERTGLLPPRGRRSGRRRSSCARPWRERRCGDERTGARRSTTATAVRLLSLIVALAAFVVAFGPPRRLAQRLGSRFGARMPVRFQRLLCAGLGVRVRRHGTLSSAPKQLIVANHVSWLDIPVLASLAPMSFLAKKEVGDHRGRARTRRPARGRLRRPAAPVLHSGGQRRMAEAMRAGCAVVLFAEATTGDGNRLLRFRSSHFEAVATRRQRGQRRPGGHPAGLSRIIRGSPGCRLRDRCDRASPGTAT